MKALLVASSREKCNDAQKFCIKQNLLEQYIIY